MSKPLPATTQSRCTDSHIEQYTNTIGLEGSEANAIQLIGDP